MFLDLLAIYAKEFRSHTRWKRADLYYEYSSFFKLTKQNIFAFTQTKNALIVIMIMNIPRSISLPRKTISLSQKVETPNSL